MVKRSVVVALLILLSLNTFSSTFTVKPVKAWTGSVYIRADGSVDPSSAPIQRDGNIYTLTDNILGSIIVERDNIIIEGSGFTLQGTGKGTGVGFSNRKNITIQDLKISGFRRGIGIYSSGYNNILNNEIVNQTEYGIYVEKSWENKIIKNTITQADWGIRITDSDRNTVSENNVMNCGLGISVDNYSFSNNITKNNLTDNADGVNFCITYNNLLMDNNITVGYWGIFIGGGPLGVGGSNNITGNFVKGAGCIDIARCGNNIITENILIANTYYDIPLKYCYNIRLEDTGNNILYHNDFIITNNGIQQVSIGENVGSNNWDNGYPSGGNYWSDYIGVDANGDGIGDTPYVIDEKNKDRYPLMKPYNIPVTPQPPTTAYILRIQSYPITGIEISYSGDYSGTGKTNFDIGPKSSPFTVTLTAPSTYQDYMFDHWELDGINQGYGATLMVKIDDEKKERIAVARYIATQIEEVLLNFSVVYENEFYYISLAVPLSNYNTAIMEFPNVYYTWFAHIDTQLLKSAYYLYRYTLDPNQYPILDVSVQVDGQRLVDENVKIEILDGLLQYVYELFMFAFPSRLEEYVWCEKQWLKSHEDLTFWVTVSDKATQILDWLTALGPIVDTVGRALGYTEQSKHVEALVKLFLSIIKGQNYLIETYGKKDADAIICILKDLNVISSDDYNGAEVYEKFQQDPDFAVTVLEKIYKDVFKSTIGPTERSLIKSFIAELKNAVISGFAVGTAVGLHAYFIHGAKWSTALKIGLSKAFTALLEKIVAPLTIATIVHRGYNLPMAQSLHDAWEDMKVISQIYSDLKRYGEKIAKPVNNQFNLTNAKLLACFLGVRCIIEFDYYIHCYTHTMGQYLNPKRLQEADGLKRFAESLLSEAKGWADMLKKIRGYAEAIVNKGDPEGSSFDFTFQPPKNVFPSAPHHPQGLILIANSTTNLIMKCGNYHFIVQNREWFTNFTNAIYVDDPYNNTYLIIFNPPEGKYDVEAQNFASLTLVKFALSTNGVILSRVGEGTTTMSFEVSSSGEIKTVVPSWWVQQQLWIIAGVIGTATILTISVALIKRRKKHMAQLSENTIKPVNNRK
ncbi:MAG: NosD domain-containing protein [Candidatus Micrarchaeaceae archaeon]